MLKVCAQCVQVLFLQPCLLVDGTDESTVCPLAFTGRLGTWHEWTTPPVQRISIFTSLGSRAGSDKSTASSKPRAAVKPLARHAHNDGQSDDHASNNDSGSGSGAAAAAAAAAASASVYANIPSSAKEEPSSSPTKSTAKTSRDKQPEPPSIEAKPTAKPTPGPSGPLYENSELAGKAAPQKPAQDGASTPSKGKAAFAPRGPRKGCQEEDALEEEKDDVYINEDLYSCYSSVRSFSVLDSFQKHLLDCLAAPETLAMEFEVGVFTVYVSLRLLLGGHHDHDIWAWSSPFFLSSFFCFSWTLKK